MVRKFSLTFIGAAIVSSLLLSAPSISFGAKDKKADETAQTVQRMESHWQTLVREPDPTRRKALIAEHRQMMVETRATMDVKPSMPAGDHGHKGMSEKHHHHDIQNTVELHTMMLDLM